MYGITDGYIFNTKNVNSDLDSAIIDARRANKISVVYKWTGNLAGDFEVWASNDDLGGMGIGFFETNVTFDTNPAGTPDIAEQEIDAPNKYYMIKFDHTVATAGNLYMNATTKLAISIASPIALFTDGTYTGASTMTVDYNTEWTDFGVGVPPIVTIGGEKAILIEPDSENLFTRVRELGHTDWTKFHLTCSGGDINALNGPDGNTTADYLREDTSTLAHRVYQTITPDGSSQYVTSSYSKAGERDYEYIRVETDGFVSRLEAFFNITTGSEGTIDAGADSHGIEQSANSWYRFFASELSDAAAASDAHIAIAQEDDTQGYQGDTDYEMPIWNPQIEIGYYPSSPINSGATATTRVANRFKWASADFPAKLREEVRLRFIPEQARDGITAGFCVLCYEDSGASPELMITFNNGQNSFKVYQTGVGNLATLAGTWSRWSVIDFYVNFVTGEFTISGLDTGGGTDWFTPVQSTEGDVHLGTTANGSSPACGLLFQPKV